MSDIEPTAMPLQDLESQRQDSEETRGGYTVREGDPGRVRSAGGDAADGPNDTGSMAPGADPATTGGGPEPVRYWKITPGTHLERWEEWRTGGYVAMDWDELGDLSGVDLDGFERRMAASVDYYEVSAPDGARQVWTFAKEIEPGHRILINRGSSEVLAVGRVTGPYFYEAGVVDFRHRIPVEWTDTHPRRVPTRPWRRTLQEIGEDEFSAIAGVASASGSSAPRSGPSAAAANEPPEGDDAYPLGSMADRTGIGEETLGRWIGVLDRRGQAVLFGPPGAGKSFAARHLARHLAGGSDGFVETIQMHPAHTYETFVAGSEASGNGLFPEFCRRARERSGRCVLIIESFDRVDLFATLGEVVHALDSRGRPVRLASGGLMTVPSNVRVIGTTDNVGRPPAELDRELVHRFAWISLVPDLNVVRRFHEAGTYDVEPLISLLSALNEEIGEPQGGLGISYFLRQDLEEQLEDIWRTEVEPGLERALVERPKLVEDFRWNSVVKRLNV